MLSVVQLGELNDRWMWGREIAEVESYGVDSSIIVGASLFELVGAWVLG